MPHLPVCVCTTVNRFHSIIIVIASLNNRTATSYYVIRAQLKFCTKTAESASCMGVFTGRVCLGEGGDRFFVPLTKKWVSMFMSKQAIIKRASLLLPSWRLTGTSLCRPLVTESECQRHHLHP